MKRVLVISIICIFLVGICILEEILVNTTLTDLKNKSTKMYELYKNSDSADTEELQNLTLKLKNYWDERENLLCFFINHKDMHEMGNEITRLISYSKFNLKEEFEASLLLVIYYSKEFNHIMGVSIQNIF